MKRPTALAAICLVVLGGCGSQPTQPAGPPLRDTAVPYVAPPQPPRQSTPFDVEPSRDALGRLSKVLTGNLVDSGNFHQSSFNPGDPMLAGTHIVFTTPSGGITCTGDTNYLLCDAISRTLPRPPRPIETHTGNWEPYIEFTDGEITYGIAAGNPMVPAKGNTLQYGSTLRFGDVECLSATDGITCVNLSSSTGFHLSRDDLTPMRAASPMPRDVRVEPRTPGNKFCGALVDDAAVTDATKALPNNGGWHWEEVGPGDHYSCRDLQLFQVGSNNVGNKALPAMPTYVLAFDRGRFVGSVTDHPYPWLRGEVDAVDPTLIHLTFLVVRDGTQSDAQIRARYANGAVTLLDQIPDGATPAT